MGLRDLAWNRARAFVCGPAVGLTFWIWPWPDRRRRSSPLNKISRAMSCVPSPLTRTLVGTSEPRANLDIASTFDPTNWNRWLGTRHEAVHSDRGDRQPLWRRRRLRQ